MKRILYLLIILSLFFTGFEYTKFSNFLKSITATKIKQITIYDRYSCTRKLNNNEIKKTLSIIKEFKSIKNYTGPTPKGNPQIINLYFTWGDVMNLFPAKKGYLLFDENNKYYVEQSEYTQLIKQLF